MNVQPGILFLVFLDRKFSPYPPVLEGGLVTVLHTLKPTSSFLLHFRIIFGVGVNLNIDFKEVFDGVLSERFLVSVFLKTSGNEAKLGWSIRP